MLNFNGLPSVMFSLFLSFHLLYVGIDKWPGGHQQIGLVRYYQGIDREKKIFRD
jgi:hypothetical protein